MNNASTEKDIKNKKLPEATPEDEVDEASIESFPASDPPGWIDKEHHHEDVKKNRK